ncbi:MAG: zinc ribbon domain-containing protein [Candidatus Nanoarchaeia archaeon]
MPIFEYECEKCGKVFEKLVSSQKEKISCPSCGSSNAKRQLSVFSATVAGSPKCELKSACPSAGTSCCSGGTCGRHSH